MHIKQRELSNKKILHICTQDYGGAGTAAYRLLLGLRSIGVQSKMLVLNCKTLMLCGESSDSDVVGFWQDANLFERAWSKVRGRLIDSESRAYENARPKGVERVSDDRAVYAISKHPLVQEADIIHLHWIAGMVDHMEFFPSVTNKHIVWTLHDMNPFTGGCHYAADCGKYETACGACPQLGSKDSNDLSRKILARKEECYRGQEIRAISPSKWLADCARRSRLFRNFKVNVIPHGLPTSVFAKRNKDYSRQLLGLPTDKILILFGAPSITNRRKGASYLTEALRLIKDGVDSFKVGLVLFGSGSTYIANVGFSVYPLGFIHNQLLLSACYSAADMFVIPSLEEAFGQTCLESMACGTPVVGFGVGGIVDMVRQGETGLLAKEGNVGELASQIEWMIKFPKERAQMGVKARQLVEREYTLEIQARRYKKCYLES